MSILVADIIILLSIITACSIILAPITCGVYEDIKEAKHKFSKKNKKKQKKMSSYLTFYVVPKGEDKKPLTLIAYSRSNDIYQAYYEHANLAFYGNGDEPNYTELTPGLAQHVVNIVREDLDKAKRNLQNRIDVYKELGNNSEEAIQDIAETKEYIKELEETIVELQFIANLVSDIEYSDFEKVLINIG